MSLSLIWAAILIPPVLPDRPGHGVPSDHLGVSATPKANQDGCAKRIKVKKMIRSLPESLIPVFQEKLGANNFEMLHGLSVSEMVDTFQAVVNAILCQTFPEKQIVISPYDDPWFNEELRKLKRQKQRQYECHGKNAK